MLDTIQSNEASRERDDFCDIRVWSGECEHTTSLRGGDKYLCDICESITGLEHEVKPAALPYISGDYNTLS